jgi:hypothetical protein
MTKAIPVRGGTCRKKVASASSPPAETSKPTMGIGLGVEKFCCFLGFKGLPLKIYFPDKALITLGQGVARMKRDW